MAFHLVNFTLSLHYLLPTPFIWQEDSSLALIVVSPLNYKKVVLTYFTTERGLCDYTVRSQSAPVPRPEIYRLPNLLLAWHYLLCQWSESFPLRWDAPEVGLTGCDEEGQKKGIDAPFILSLHLPKACKGNVTMKLLKGNFFWSHQYISVWHLLC